MEAALIAAMGAIAVGATVWTVLGLVDRLLYPPLGPLPRREDSATPPPRVSVLIPARNEQHNIGDCVHSVLSQKGVDLECIVLNDQSTDGTAQVLATIAATDPRLKVLDGQPLPAGWVGKGWALYQAHQRAGGDWVALVDADVRVEPDGLASLVAHAERTGVDMLNPIPRFVTVTFWERVMQPMLWVLVRIRFPWVWVNGIRGEAMAFGPLILIRKPVYDAIDGHRHVASDILEDVALARLLRHRGFATRVQTAKDLLRVRMYRNLGELVNGWVKTAFGAMGYNLPLMLTAIVGVFFAAAQPVLTILYGALVQRDPWLLLGALQMGAIVARFYVDSRENDFPFWIILMYPVGIALVLGMQVLAVWRYYFGAYNWKGRDYRKPRPADTEA